MRHRFIKAICLSALLSTSAFGWSAKGHVLITEMALQQMTDAQRQTLDHYATVLTDALPILLQDQLEDAYAGASLFAKLSPLPDRWRELTLEQLFSSLNAPIPEALKPYRNQRTATWHFIDRPYPANTRCTPANEMNIINGLSLLRRGWQTTHDTKTRAILLVMMSHLVEDAHQPLHMLSRTTPTCRQDAGGNKRLVLIGHYRPINLHQWWDSAGGYFKHRQRFDEQAKTLRLQCDTTWEAGQLQDLDPVNWAVEAYNLAPFIYSAANNQHLSRLYSARSQVIACQRMTLAGYRLAGWLTPLLVAQ